MPFHLLLLAGALAALWLPAAGPARAEDVPLRHGIAMHGEPKYPPGFDHFDYADPDAPKGGELIQAATGTFDSLNPFIVLGRVAAGVRSYHFASLMARAWDEPFSLYGYVAESVELPEDRSWVTFRLNPNARFHDGTPITVDDVLFTVAALRQYGLPSFRRNYDRIESIERIGDNGVRFAFTAEADRETPLIIGLMPILSQAWYRDHPLNQTSLEIPLGSGPYRIVSVDPGRRIVYERVPDWWAADLPAFRGFNNFDRLRFDYYRDSGVALEAFKAGDCNFRREASAERWATGYDFPAAKDGRVTLLALPHHRPEGMRGFAFNTRRPLFQDRRVREALGYAFDFEWVNRTLLYGQYRRTDSFFVNSDLAATGLPGGRELALLEPWRGQVPEEVFTKVYAPPVSDGSGMPRDNLRRARDLLKAAGWEVRDGRLVDANGNPFAFEILLGDPSDERIAMAYADTLRRLGIEARVRTVDSAQYAARTETYDFDMMIHQWRVTLSPGAEQDFYWGSRSATVEGTRNYPGVRSPAVDALVRAVSDAGDREDLVAATRALDRVLLWGFYVVPLYYQDKDFLAYWGRLGWVETADPLYGTQIEAWWAGG